MKDGISILAVSDIHFHAYKAHSSLMDGVNSRLIHQINAWRQAIDVGAAKGCALMLIAGDLFEVRGSLKPSVFNPVTALVMETLGKGFDIGLVPGNHDMEHLEAGESAVDSWDYLKAISPVGVKSCTVFKSAGVRTLCGLKVLGIPYMRDTAAFKEVFQLFSERERPDVTLIHQGIDNFNKGGAYPSTGLSAEWLEDNNPGVILCGHYHWPALSRGGRVVNVGGLVQHRFSDEGSERGCWTLGEGGIEFTVLQSPKFLTVSDVSKAEKDCRGAIVRVRARSAKDAAELRERIEDAGALSVVVQIEKEFKTAHERTIAIKGPRAMLEEYLDIAAKYSERKSEILDLFDRLCLG